MAVFAALDIAQEVLEPFYPEISTVAYYGVLEGGALADLYLPISSFTLVRRGAYTTTPDSLSMTVQAAGLNVDDISARTAEDIVLYRVVTFADGTQSNQEMCRTNFNTFSTYLSGKKKSYVLEGERSVNWAATSSVNHTLQSVIELRGDFSDPDARKEMLVGTQEFFNIKPGDVIYYGSDSLIIDYMTISCSGRLERVSLVEVEA